MRKLAFLPFLPLLFIQPGDIDIQPVEILASGITYFGLTGNGCPADDPWLSWGAQAELPKSKTGKLYLTIFDEFDVQGPEVWTAPGQTGWFTIDADFSVLRGVEYQAVVELEITNKNGKVKTVRKESDWVSCPVIE